MRRVHGVGEVRHLVDEYDQAFWQEATDDAYMDPPRPTPISDESESPTTRRHTTPPPTAVEGRPCCTK